MTAIEANFSAQEYFERGSLGSTGLDFAGFQKALDAAGAAMLEENPDQPVDQDGNVIPSNDSTYTNAFHESVEQTLSAKSDKVQAKADLLGERAAEIDDPARAEILNARAEISADRAEHLQMNADVYGELSSLYDASGSNEGMREVILERFAANADYHEDRAGNLADLSNLVRENGNPEWADKILARADTSADRSERVSEMVEAVTVDPSITVPPQPSGGIENEASTNPVSADPVGGVSNEDGPWLGEDVVSTIQAELNTTEEFGTSVVDSVREVSAGEMEGIRELATALGADEADLGFLDFIKSEVGIKIVFVDNLVAENGAFGAFGGDASIPESEGIGILMDSTFADADFDDGISGINSVSAQGGEVLMNQATILLQDLEIVDFSGEVGDGDPFPELSAGESVTELDATDQAAVAELMAGDFLEDTAVFGDTAAPTA